MCILQDKSNYYITILDTIAALAENVTVVRDTIRYPFDIYLTPS